MMTKNIFRMLLVAVGLLVGVNNVKATVFYDSTDGLGSYDTYDFEYGAFKAASVGDELHITYEIQPQVGWTPDYAIKLGDITTISVSQSGTYVYTLDDDFFDKINTDDKENRATYITPQWLTIYRIELVPGSASTPTHTLTITVDGESSTRTVKEGMALASLLPIPTKADYNFTGWTNMPDDGLMPQSDLELIANFSIIKYNVIFKIDNVEVDRVEYAPGETIAEKAAPDPRTGYTFSGWGGYPQDMTMPKYDINVSGSFNINYHYIVYNVDGGYYDNKSNIPYGATLDPDYVPTTNPTKEGYIFTGWTDLPETMPDQDLTVEAVFVSTSEPEVAKQYLAFKTPEYCAANWNAATNTFTWGLGGWNPAFTFMEAVGVSGDLSNWKKLHLHVSDWSNASAQTLKVVFKTDDDGQWPPSGPTKEFDNLSPDVSGNIEINLEGVEWGDCDIENIADLTIYGCTRDNNQTDASVKVTDAYFVDDTTYDTYSITVNAGENGSASVDKPRSAVDQTVTITITPENGYELNNISVVYGNNQTVTLNGSGNTRTFTMPANNVIVNAQFTKSITIGENETVIWDGSPAIVYGSNENNLFVRNPDSWLNSADEGSILRIYADINNANDWKLYVGAGNWDSPTFVDLVNGDLNLYHSSDNSFYNETKGCFEFEFNENTKTNLQNHISSEGNVLSISFKGLTIYKVTNEPPVIVPKHTLTFMMDDQQTVIETMQVAEGAEIPAITPPTKTGYVFSSWANMPLSGNMPASDLTLVAVFTEATYTLTFKIGDEVYGEPTQLAYGATITAPTDVPERTGYTFSGWQNVPQTMPAQDLTIIGYYTKEKTYETLHVGSTKYSTFYSTQPLYFQGSESVKAFIAIQYSATEVKLRQVIGAVAANTPLVLKGDAANASANIEVVESGESYGNNLLVGVRQSTSINSSQKYVLVEKSGTVKFADTGNHAATVPANKAYLQAPASAGGRQITVFFEDDVTRIETISGNGDAPTAIYNLKGQRIATPKRGVNIIGGKKVMIK